MMTKIGSVAKVLGIGTVGAFIGAVGYAALLMSDPDYAAAVADWAEILDARMNGKNLSITINRKVPNKNEEEEF